MKQLRRVRRAILAIVGEHRALSAEEELLICTGILDSMKGRDWPHGTSFDLFNRLRNLEQYREDHVC